MKRNAAQRVKSKLMGHPITSSQLQEWDAEQEKFRETLIECEQNNEGIMAINLKVALAKAQKKREKYSG